MALILKKMTHEESSLKYENIIWSLKNNYEAVKQIKQNNYF